MEARPARYYHLTPEGREGPFDAAVLTQMALQGLVGPESQFECEDGVRCLGSEVPGLIGPQGAIGPSSYARPPKAAKRSIDPVVTLAILFMGAFIISPVFSWLALAFSIVAYRQKHPARLMLLGVNGFLILLSIGFVVSMMRGD